MTKKSAPVTSVSFEETLISLQSIVETLEAGNLPLAETIARFEEGTRLAEVCRTLVSEAELRITVLTSNVDAFDDADNDDDDLVSVPF